MSKIDKTQPIAHHVWGANSQVWEQPPGSGLCFNGLGDPLGLYVQAYDGSWALAPEDVDEAPVILAPGTLDQEPESDETDQDIATDQTTGEIKWPTKLRKKLAR